MRDKIPTDAQAKVLQWLDTEEKMRNTLGIVLRHCRENGWIETMLGYKRLTDSGRAALARWKKEQDK